MKSPNYYSRKVLRQEAAHMSELIERITFQNNLLHKVIMKHGYTHAISVKLGANQLNYNYYQGQLDGIQLALRLMK